jgi:hypothetical protein
MSNSKSHTVSGLAASIRSATGKSFELRSVRQRLFVVSLLHLLDVCWFYGFMFHSTHSLTHSSPRVPSPQQHVTVYLESETFDLASQNTSTITNTIQDAFSEPLPLVNTMIRLTFITGAGKQGRQKYDEGAAKAVTSTLSKLGFSEDRGASCVVACAGSYKLQHDTGKNLKTVVVFPNVLDEPADASNDVEAALSSSLLPADTPEYMIATASLAVFSRMVTSKCPSWSQKKACLAALEALTAQLAALDAKLVKGKLLNKDEQAFYELVSNLEDKEAHVRTALHAQVEDGNVTADEVNDVLIPHNAERLAALQKEGKKGPLKKAQERQQLLKDINPTAPAALRYEATIRKLRKELLPILNMHLESKNLRSMRETQLAGRQEELEEEIMELEEASRGWFEDDDAFEKRVELSRAAFAATQKSKATKKSYSGAAGAGKTIPSSKWVLPGDVKKAQAWGSSNQGKKKQKKTGGDVFAAMMIESDSDDDEAEDDFPPPSRAVPEPAVEKSETAVKASGGGATKKKNKKSKNKKKNSSAGASEEDALNQVLAAKKKKEDVAAAAKQEVANPYLDFVTAVLLPSITGILAWFVTLMFGKPKSSNKKRN